MDAMRTPRRVDPFQPDRTKSLPHGLVGAWLLVAATAVTAAVPETPLPRRIGLAEGLPATQINVLAQDHSGYLWVGTADGLARYDGVAFQVHRHQPDDPATLPGNSIQALHVDARDRIWVGVENEGLAMLDAGRRSWRRFDRQSLPGFDYDEVWAITSDPEGGLWLGTYGGGLYRFDGESGLVHYPARPEDPDALPAGIVLDLAWSHDGSLWVATTAGAARFDGSRFERLEPERLSGPFVYSLLPERDGSLWLGTNGGLDQLDARGVVQAMPWGRRAELGAVHSIVRDRGDGYWFGTQSGLFRVSRQLSLDRRKLRPAQITAGVSMSLLEDHEGGLWVASQGGLRHFPPGWKRFAVLDRGEPDSGLGSGRMVRGAAEDAQGRLWLAASGAGLRWLDPGRGESVAVSLPGMRPGVPLQAMGVLAHSDGSVWLGDRLGLVRYDPAHGEYRVWSVDSPEDPVPEVGLVDQFLEDAEGNVWLLSSGGGGVQIRSADGRVLDTIPGDGSRGLGDGDIEQIGFGPQGAIWVAGESGVLYWDAKVARFKPVPGAPESRVHAFAVGTEGRVWLALLGTLVGCEWDGEHLRETVRVGQPEGLPAVQPGGVIADRRGAVWLTTLRGLFRYDPAAGRLRRFGERDGLPSPEFHTRPPAVTRDGGVLAGTPAGLVMFEPHAVEISSESSPLVIDSVQVRRAGRDHALDPGAELRLAAGDRDLRVTARLLAFADPGAHRFAFRLVGYDDGWVEVGAAGERTFPQLLPGEHVLEVRGANADGVWSPARRLVVFAEPDWWQTGWARAGYLLAALAVIALAALAYRLRVKRRYAFELARQKQHMAEQASEAKSRFLANLGHEVRTPMTGVLGMSELLLSGPLEPEQRQRVEAIAQAGRHLLRLVDDALDLARIEAGKLNLKPEPFELHGLVYEVDALLAPIARSKGLEFRCEAGSGLPRWVRGDAYRVRQILLNLGHNAIKFTGSGRVAIRAMPGRGADVRFEIADTGPGLTPEQQRRVFERFEQVHATRAPTARDSGGSGLGLSICRELVQAMGGAILLDSAPGRGSVFTVELPLPEIAAPESPAAASPRERHVGARVLLVEDDPTVAEVILGLLRAGGYRAGHAAHALDALGRLEAESFDLALIDLDLPGLGGQELATLLRGHGKTMPLIAITARADSAAEGEALAAGMNGFLRKPLTGEMLVAAIEATLGAPAQVPPGEAATATPQA